MRDGASRTVGYEVRDGVAVALIDSPPVNAINAAVRQGLLDAVRRAEGDASVRALLIACAGRTFLSGADLGELRSTIDEPGYVQVLGALEGCSKPTVAVLHGTALGGGLETAMACHYRCAVPSAKMGMPEITLGILPGAGGTQRLPRLVGSRAALEMLVSGAPITAQRAVEIGLLDRIVEGDSPVEAGLAYARELVASGAAPRPTRERTADLTGFDGEGIEQVLTGAARALKGRTTQSAIVESVTAASQPFDEGLAVEDRLSKETLKSVEGRALIHVFFAERECGRIPGLPAGVKAQEIRKAAVVGAGTMGGGIAMALSDAGIPVALIEAEQAFLDRGLGTIRKNYEATVKRGRLTPEALEERMGRIAGTLDYSAAADADVVIEAVFEDMDLKKSILSRLDQVCQPDAIIASNTSSLSLTELASATNRADKVVGLHFFSPANVMRLLEIVRGDETSMPTLATGLALAKTLRKVGVVSGDAFGFIGNRMMLDGYFREAEQMLLEGVAPERIDAALEGFGFAMGPNRVNDMAGVDVGTKVRAELFKSQTRPAPYHAVSDALTPLGRLGQKTGAGVYRYEPGDRNPHRDPEVDALIQRLAAEHAIAPQDSTDEEIVDRCILSLINVGAEVLAEGVAYRASDIDVVWTAGYGFPRHKGGPMFWADEIGLREVVRRIRDYQARTGSPYWVPAPLLVELAEAGKSFADRDAGS